MIRKKLLEALYAHVQLELPGFQLSKFIFHDAGLSPVRNQKGVGACTFVASITCIEMMCRMENIVVPKCTGTYFLDIDDIFDNIYKKFCNPNKLIDIEGVSGTSIPLVLRYIRDFGLPLTSVPRDPRIRNLYSYFCNEVYRHRIVSYSRLLKSEAVELADFYPIIVGSLVYESFYKWPRIIYDGPYPTEAIDDLHAMVVVGRVTLERNNVVREYFIVQNSWGEEDFGCQGFVLVPVEKDMTFEFWMPAVTLGIDQLLFDVKSDRYKSRKQHAVCLGADYGSSVSIENDGLLMLTCLDSRRVVQISAGFMLFSSLRGERFSEIVGSSYHMAPEELKRNYGPEIDIWSARVILYILMCGVPPLSAESEQGVTQAIIWGKIDFECDPWPSISDSAQSLVRDAGARSYLRLTAQQVLEHSLLQNAKKAPNIPLGDIVKSRLKQFSLMYRRFKRKDLRVVAKKLGGSAFRAKDFTTAIDCHTQFIDGGTMVSPTVFAPRGLSYLMSEMPNEALHDAMQALVVSPNWATAFYLQAAALFVLGMENDTQESLKEATNLETKRNRI